METPVTEKPVAKLALPMGRVVSFATITAAGFALGKVSGVLREIVVSAHFGLSSQLDAYFIAGTVPTIINNIVAGSAITAAIMPTFARYLTAGKRDEFWYVASVITNIVLLITVVLTALSIVFAGPIIDLVGAGFPPATQVLATNLLIIMMPTLVLGAALNMLMAVLNALDRFTAPALIFLALNFGIITTVILLTPVLGIYAVAWGFLIGVTLQVLIQFIELRLERPKFYWRLDWRHPAVGQVLRAFIPITALSIVAQINYVVDKTMATGLPAGSVGALYYADSILGLFYMLGISLGIGVFPSLSRMAVTHDTASTARAVSLSLRLLIFILMPLTLLLIAFPAPVIGVLLGRGQFDAGAVQMTAQAMVMYAIGLTAVGAMYVLQRAFYALSDGTTPLVVGSLVVAAHIGLNLLLIPSMAHAGIALSASITSIVGATTLLALLARRVSGISLTNLAVFLLRCFVFGALSAAPVAWLFASLRLNVATPSARLIGVGLATAGGLIYFALASLTRTRESEMLWQAARRFLKIDPRRMTKGEE
jgi:putative peptidoglycan lipid II flippase